MSTFPSLSIDVWKIIESYRIEYDPKKHTWKGLVIIGNLDGIKWLHKNGKGICGNSMDWCSRLVTIIYTFLDISNYNN